MKILCIEDDKNMLKLFEAMLKKVCLPNDEIFLAENAEQGFDIVKTYSPDIIFTDMMLPDKNGIDLLKEIKEYKNNIEVIVVTGEASIKSAVKAIKFGAYDYLTKPVNSEVMKKKISNLRELISKNEFINEEMYAREITEEKTSQNLKELEILYYKSKDKFDNIKRILDSDKNDSEKISEINSLLQ
jgi:DNA-binding NtrC family response regulator